MNNEIDWNKIAKECTYDFNILKPGEDNQIVKPTRAWIRAWMQTHYDIIKLPGFFFRLFSNINNIDFKKIESLD